MALGVTLAGQDSTAGHICWTIIDLLQHPDELRKAFKGPRSPCRIGYCARPRPQAEQDGNHR